MLPLGRARAGLTDGDERTRPDRKLQQEHEGRRDPPGNAHEGIVTPPPLSASATPMPSRLALVLFRLQE
jgi:hypothetical protein